MGVEVKREEPKPTTPPIESVTFSDRYSKRTITIRPTQGDPHNANKKTVVCTFKPSNYTPPTEFKFVAMLGDLQAFAHAILDLCDGK